MSNPATDGQEAFASVTVTKTVTKRQVQNLLVGLFENGCSSWFLGVQARRLPDNLMRSDFKEGGKMQDPDCYFHPYQIIPVTEGCALALTVENPLSDKPLKFWMGPAEIRKGVEVMASKYPRHFQDWMEENDDAITSDIFGQCIVYGEEIFC